MIINAQVAESTDARDLKSLDHNGRAGLSPALGTIYIKEKAMSFKAGLVLWTEDDKGNIKHLAELELHELNGMETRKRRTRRKVSHLNIDLGSLTGNAETNLISQFPKQQRKRRKAMPLKMREKAISMRLEGHMPAEIAKALGYKNNDISKMLLVAKKVNPELAALLNSRYKRKGK